jgi:hypothetical protein
MRKFFRWLFELPDYPEKPVVAKVVVRPVEINPDAHKEVAFAEWRIAHIQRWLDHNPLEPAARREFLKAEREMHINSLKMIDRR